MGMLSADASSDAQIDKVVPTEGGSIEIVHIEKGMGVCALLPVSGVAISEGDRAVTIKLPCGAKAVLTRAEATTFARIFSIMLEIPWEPTPDGLEAVDQ